MTKSMVTISSTTAEVKTQAEQWRDAGQMYYCKGNVCAIQDSRTHQIEVRGTLGIAPDDHTIILYPIYIVRFGYWNKTNVCKQMAEVRRELQAQIKAQGYKLSEPLEVSEIRF